MAVAKKPYDPARFIPPPGLRRKLSWGRCPRCGALVGRGLDADVLARSVAVEPMLLSAHGEAQAMALSWAPWTFDVDHGRLERRDEWARRARPAGAHHGVLVEHACWVTLPEAWRQHERVPMWPVYVQPDEPAF